MSRLYGKLISDRCKTDATAGANERLNYRLTWGSAKNPQVAVIVNIVWNKDQDKPHVHVFVKPNINHTIELGPNTISNQRID